MIRWFSKPQTPIEPLSAARFNGEIDRQLGAALCDLGFEKSRQNAWVQDLGNGRRQVVRMMHWKGARSTPQWGYSLDHVPHFDTAFKRLSWHRTNKSAMLDVFPLYQDFSRYQLSRFARPEDHAGSLQELTPKIIREITAFFAAGSGDEVLLEILARSEGYRADDVIGFWNWQQLPLAYAFTLNRCGKTQQANQVLEAYLDKHEVAPEGRQQLMKRFAIARER